jgi:hypothetical protein
VYSESYGDTIESKPIVLLPLGKLAIEGEPANMPFYPGADIKFTATVVAENLTDEKDVSYQWYKSGKALSNTARSAETTTKTLTINSTDAAAVLDTAYKLRAISKCKDTVFTRALRIV